MDLVRPSRMTFPEGTVLYSQSSRSQAVPALGIVATPQGLFPDSWGVPPTLCGKGSSKLGTAPRVAALGMTSPDDSVSLCFLMKKGDPVTSRLHFGLKDFLLGFTVRQRAKGEAKVVGDGDHHENHR